MRSVLHPRLPLRFRPPTRHARPLAAPARRAPHLLRSKEVLFAARAQGRTRIGYEAGIRIGRVYHALPWLARLERALGFRPHTIGLWLTDRLLTAPPRRPGEGAGAAEGAEVPAS